MNKVFSALHLEPFSPCGRRVGMRGSPAKQASGVCYEKAPAAPTPHPSLLPQGEKGFLI